VGISANANDSNEKLGVFNFFVNVPWVSLTFTGCHESFSRISHSVVTPPTG
jgi:hypothetical protein